MLTFLSFIFMLAGGVNWLMIGLLQYDYIAGFFGFQASIFSRICYILFGFGAIYILLRAIVNKGTFKIFERKKKKQKSELQPANVEAAKEIKNDKKDELFDEHLEKK